MCSLASRAARARTSIKLEACSDQHRLHSPHQSVPASFSSAPPLDKSIPLVHIPPVIAPSSPHPPALILLKPYRNRVLHVRLTSTSSLLPVLHVPLFLPHPLSQLIPIATMQAWHKAQKAKTIKKGKAANLKVRQERLAKRNPFRLQARIDELKGSTRPHDVKLVAELEMELTAVKKAREAAGIKDDEAKWRRNERNEGGRKDGRDEQKMRRDRLAGAGLGVGGREGDGEDSDSGMCFLTLGCVIFGVWDVGLTHDLG